MSCSHWHRLIALEVGGDLDPRLCRSLEKHLEGCAACRDLAGELRSQREALLRLDREAKDGVVLGSVRHAVLADLADRRWPFFRLPAGGQRVAIAVAAAGILVVTSIVLRSERAPTEPIVAERKIPTAVLLPTTEAIPSPTTDVPVEPPRAMSPEAPVESVESGQLQLASGDVPTRRHATPQSPSAPTEPMTLKILTDDPDVIIYWIVEPKGDKDNAQKKYICSGSSHRRAGRDADRCTGIIH
jgi:hypothetical protein